MAMAKTITDGGSNNGVGVQGTTGVVTLYAASDQYNFFNPFITGKNVVLPDPDTTAPIFLNNITVSGNGKVLTGTWGPSTVLSGHTNIGTAAAQNATVTQCYVSGVTSTHTFTGTTNITGASAAASCSVNATGHGLTVGNVVNIVGVLGTMGAAINGTWPVLTVPDANHFTIGVNTTGLTATASTGSVGACTYGVIQAYGASTPGALYSAFPLAPWTIGTQVNYVPQKTDVHWTAWRGNTNPTPQFNVRAPPHHPGGVLGRRVVHPRLDHRDVGGGQRGGPDHPREPGCGHADRVHRRWGGHPHPATAGRLGLEPGRHSGHLRRPVDLRRHRRHAGDQRHRPARGGHQRHRTDGQ